MPSPSSFLAIRKSSSRSGPNSTCSWRSSVRSVTSSNVRQFYPFLALGMAMTGDAKAAHAIIDKTPVDCTVCLRQRANIDAWERNWGGADYWFARAVKDAPSPPFAWTDWGRAKLAQGDAAGAIAKFEIAHAKGPRFADPLEMWGEALMLEHRADLALAKFEEADRDAPNWGRLHLKWGRGAGVGGAYAGSEEAIRAGAVAGYA